MPPLLLYTLAELIVHRNPSIRRSARSILAQLEREQPTP
mgnify:CR=1 FL=1